MNLASVWHSLVPAVTAVVVNGTEPIHQHPQLEELAETFGCHLLLHRISNPAPCFASRSLAEFIKFNGSGISITEMLQFIGRQRFPIVPFWNAVASDLENSFDQPQLLACCVTDLNGTDRWCTASYGLLPTPYDLPPVVMLICYELHHLGPVGMAKRNHDLSDLQLRQRFVLLSQREKEVLALMLDERSTGDIARQLNLSRFTVNTHRKNLMQKLEARTNMALTVYRPLLQQ